MDTQKKSPTWLIALVLVVAFGAPLAIGVIEIRVARNAQAETAAFTYLQAIAKAENDYRKANDGFAPKLEDLKGLPTAVTSYKLGYRQVSRDSYIAMAWPLKPGKHGRRYFFLDQTGIIRYEVMHPAGPMSDPVPAQSK